jgi:hypothetical protein
MTSTNLQFELDAMNMKMFIGVVAAPITGALASNINTVFYQNGGGWTIFNDRPPVPETFTDPSPYQGYIEEWMQSVSLRATAPLSLAQAIAVKAALIDAIWAVKRQAPVSVITSLGTFSFDATDLTGVQAQGALVANSIVPTINSLISDITAINTDIGTLVAALNSAVNGAFSSHNSSVITSLGDIVTTGNSITGNIESTLNGWGGGTGTLIIQLSTQGISVSNFSNMAFTGLSTVNPTAPTISVSYSGPTPPATLSGGLSGSANFIPIGGTSYPAFTTADQIAIVSAAMTQRNNKQLVRYQKQAALAALATIAAVIAYDTTTGW